MARQLKIVNLALLATLFVSPSFARDDRPGQRPPERQDYQNDRREDYRDDRRQDSRDDRRQDQWVLLGEQSVGFNVDRDTINVGREEGAFKQIRIESRANDIFLYTIRVVFGNGTDQRVQVNALVPAGGRSAPIDLTGERRAIRTITLDYKARPGFLGRTVVSVYGNQVADGGQQAGTPPYGGKPDEPRGQSQVLDQQTYDRRTDRIEFRIPRRDLRLSQLSLRAIDDNVSLESLEIRYNSGPSQFVNIYDRLAAGEETEPIKIQSDRRFVTGVTVIKRPSWRPGQSRIELLGVGREPPRPSLGAEPGRAPPGWVLFGAQTVGFGVDRDVVDVGDEIGQFSRIALSVQEADVFLREITLVYANGQRETKEVYTLIPANSRTRPIEVSGNRFLRKIELVYQSRPERRASRAVVEVYGEYDRRWIGDRGGYRDHNRGWLMLGAQRAQMFSSDDDAFVIGSQLGTFRALRLVAKRHAVRITGIRITYGNGDVENLPLFQELLDGQSTRNIDLIRRERYIKRVDVRYRTKLNFQGEGLVELWGLR